MDTDKILAFFQRRRNAYRFAMLSPAGRQVLGDLQGFCCADVTTSRGDSAHEMAVREGRRQVWLRIQRALNLNPDQMLAITQEKDHP